MTLASRLMLSDGRLGLAVEWARSRGAAYADARYVEREHESVTFKDGELESADRSSDRGVGLRVLRDGAWGFAASDRTEPASLWRSHEAAVSTCGVASLDTWSPEAPR